MKNRSNRAVQWFQNLKYRSKLNLILILVAVLPLTIVSSFMIRGFRNLLTERELEGLQTSLNQTCNTYRAAGGYFAESAELLRI